MNDNHYLKAVTDLSDTHNIVAACDIYSQTGIKLVAAGIQINSRMYDRLVQHKLLPSLDKALSMENVLNSELILADVLELLEGNDSLILAAGVVDQRDSYNKIIQNITLPKPLSFKLTVAKEQFPLIYQHSLLIVLISVYLAHCEGMSFQEKVWVALAALFHDIGTLHIDPKLLEPAHVMSATERRHLYTHPLSGYMTLYEFPELPAQIANAVLEHHEKMDGSGYPRGLRSKKISRYGQIIGISELVSKAFNSDKHKVTWGKLKVMLKLNSKQYGDGLIGHLNIFNDDVDALTKESESEHVIDRVNLIAKLFSDFNDISDHQNSNPIYEFAEDRLAELRLALFSAGVDPSDPQSLIQMFVDDPECINEFAPIIDETIWQFKSLLLEILRQWPEATEPTGDVTNNPENAWLGNMKLTLTAIDNE